MKYLLGLTLSALLTSCLGSKANNTTQFILIPHILFSEFDPNIIQVNRTSNVRVQSSSTINSPIKVSFQSSSPDKLQVNTPDCALSATKSECNIEVKALAVGKDLYLTATATGFPPATSRFLQVID